MKYYFTVDKRDIMLEVPGSAYYPADDSELFADFIVKKRVKFLRKRVLEIGSGSGLLSILCSRFGADVLAVDINPDAVLATRENAIINKVELVTAESDLFSGVKEKYDIIIFNAPYLPDEDVLTKKAQSINYNKGDIIKRFLLEYRKYLRKNGKVYILVSSITGEKIGGKIVSKKKIDWEELRIIELV
ncbi:MAG: HemK2/MTQ2 family protein methyltransferase [Candidatus Aenigmatarchaeota archaeon]